MEIGQPDMHCLCTFFTRGRTHIVKLTVVVHLGQTQSDTESEPTSVSNTSPSCLSGPQTVHKAGKMKDHTEHSSLAEDTLRPVSKESTILSFSMEMIRDQDLEVGQEGEGKEDGGIEEDCQVDSEENEEGGDLLIVSMTKTSISVVRGRGCDSSSPCQGCHGTGCTFNDVVVVAESSEVVLGE